MISYLFSIILFICTLSIVQAQTPPIVNVTIFPTSVIVVGENINFAATARTFTNVANCAVAFHWSLFQSPVPPVNAGPIFGAAAQPETEVRNINFAGLYIFTITATDCQNQITEFNFNVRVLGGTYDIATIRAAIDAKGTFGINGITTPVNGFLDGQTLSISSTNPVAPGDVFTLIGRNIAQGVAPNPAMVAATITWRDMNFNTNPATWTCTAGNLTLTTASTAWMKAGFNTVLPAAVSQGTNVLGSTWATLNNGNPLQVDPQAQFLWTTSTLNFPATDSSIVSCRTVFNPPAEIVTGITFVTSAPAPTTPPTVAPTLPPTTAPTTAPTLAPTVPATLAPTIPATLAPTIPAMSSSSTGGTGQVINNQNQGGNTVTAGGGNTFNPMFVAIPVAVVVAVVALILIIRQRRKSMAPKPDYKLSEQV